MNRPPTPANACDCHMHIYDNAYPLASTATFKPPHAPVAEYKKVQQALGLRRVILVQPTGYGFDNRCMLDAMPAFGADARAICVIAPDTPDSELERLHAAGVRGVRFMMIAGVGGVLPWEALEQMAARIAPLGWNINLQLDGRELPQRKALIDRVPGKLVIDHTGKFLEPVAPEHESFKALLDVLDRPERWVKLSAPYETSKVGPPHYEDVGVLARSLLRTHPDRCLWASNWPHPNRNPPPPSEAMLALLDEWTNDAKLSERVLVANPEQLYGF
jgi:D-galactarolactone isomerase